MATAVTADTYLQQIHTARTQLHECFSRAHELLAEREARLLRELETIQYDYDAIYNSHREELQKLEVSKQAEKDNKAIEDINRKILQILKISPGTTIKFQWNTHFDEDLQHAGEIITTISQPVTPQLVTPKPVIPEPVIPDYKNKSIPTITRCKHTDEKSTSFGELCQPNGIAISQTGIIYIADTGNNRVQAFSPNGEFCFRFLISMNGPYGICINNDTVYVSQWLGNFITSYKLDGKYLNKIGSHGTKIGQFKDPRGIAVSPTTGHLYVCDRNNHRVQLFHKDLKFNAILSNNVKSPMDVKLTNDLVIVLDVDNPCIHIFSITDHSLIDNVISRGAGEQICYPRFFTLDAELNLLLSDCGLQCVSIFSLAGEIKARIGKKGHAIGQFVEPTGIVIDGQNRIIVVSQNRNTSLQIF